MNIEHIKPVVTDAIDGLMAILHDAGGYLRTGNDLAALGTLIMLDARVEDLTAALHLFRSTVQNRGGS